MPCPTDRDLSTYLDGAHADERTVAEHVRSCAPCRDRLEKLADADLLMKAGMHDRALAEEVEVPTDPELVLRLRALAAPERPVRADEQDDRVDGPRRSSRRGRRSSRRVRVRGRSSRRRAAASARRSRRMARPTTRFAWAIPVAAAAAALIALTIVLQLPEPASNDRQARSDAGENVMPAERDRPEILPDPRETSPDAEDDPAPSPSSDGGTSPDLDAPRRSDTPVETRPPRDRPRRPRRPAAEDGPGARDDAPTDGALAGGSSTPRTEDEPAPDGENEPAVASTPEDSTPRVEETGRAVAVRAVGGPLGIRRRDGRRVAPEAGQMVDVGPGDRLTAADGAASIQVDESVILCLREGSSAGVTRPAGQRDILASLDEGEVFASAVPDAIGGGLTVRTGDTDVAVRGAATVGRTDEGGRVGVLEGEAILTGPSEAGAPGETNAVPAGHEGRFGAGSLEIESADVERAVAWARSVYPRAEVVAPFPFGFEDGRTPFSGERVRGDARSGRWAVEAERITDNEYWGNRARARLDYPTFRMREGLVLRFSVKLDEPSPVLVQIEDRDDRTENSTYHRIIGEGEIRPGAWRTVVIPLDELVPYEGETPRGMPEGHLLGRLGFWAGRPDDPVSMRIDDVMLYRRSTP